jgi:hypothetical protein
MNLPPPLLADIVDVLQVLLPLLAFVIWVVSQAMGEKREPVPAGGPKPRPEEPEDRELRDEIEKFLRQAADNQENAKNDPELEDWPDPDEVLREQQRREQRRRQQRARERQSTAPPPRGGQAEFLDEVIVAEPVGGEALVPGQEHLHTSDFGDRLPHLGETVHSLHDRAERRLRERFSHDLVSVDDYVNRDLGRAATAAPDASTAPPQSPLAQLLRDPATMRQAIVLHEILRRPEERW